MSVLTKDFICQKASRESTELVEGDVDVDTGRAQLLGSRDTGADVQKWSKVEFKHGLETCTRVTAGTHRNIHQNNISILPQLSHRLVPRLRVSLYQHNKTISLVQLRRCVSSSGWDLNQTKPAHASWHIYAVQSKLKFWNSTIFFILTFVQWYCPAERTWMHMDSELSFSPRSCANHGCH